GDGLVSVEPEPGIDFGFCFLQECIVCRFRGHWDWDLPVRAGFSGGARFGGCVSFAGASDGRCGPAEPGRDVVGVNYSELGVPDGPGRHLVYGFALAPARFTRVGDCERKADQGRVRPTAGVWVAGGRAGADQVLTANVTSFRGKILVVRGGAIGDFILTLPALAALRGQFPQSWLEVLGYPHIVPLAIEGGVVNAVRSIEARALAGFFARHGELDPDLIDYFSEFDLIVSYLYDPDEIFQENVAKCITGQFIAGPHRPDEDTGVHAAKVFLQPLERLAIFEADPVPRLALAAPVRPSAQLALHPGSGSESKNWPEAKWHEFIGRLLEETPFTFLMVGGEAEGDRLQRLARELPGSRITLAQSLPLPELAR